MLRWIFRAGLIRFLGRRVVPLLLVYDAIRLLRAWRKRWTDPA